MDVLKKAGVKRLQRMAIIFLGSRSVGISLEQLNK